MGFGKESKSQGLGNDFPSFITDRLEAQDRNGIALASRSIMEKRRMMIERDYVEGEAKNSRCRLCDATL